MPKAAFWCTDNMAAILGHLTSVLNLSMRTKTGIPRFLGSARTGGEENVCLQHLFAVVCSGLKIGECPDVAAE